MGDTAYPPVRRVGYLCALYVSVILVCFRMAQECTAPDNRCTRQVMGHIYPGTFMLGLAWSWNKPVYRTRECMAMVVFWLFYWAVDAVQQLGVDFDDLKTLQHYMFTMFVGLCGGFRLARGPTYDTFIMVLLVAGFGLFVAIHPQPNAIGVTMHAVCSAWLGCFLLAYLAKAELEASAFMVMAATAFVSSQLALTAVATHHMDPVAYFTFVSVFSLAVESLAL